MGKQAISASRAGRQGVLPGLAGCVGASPRALMMWPLLPAWPAPAPAPSLRPSMSGA